MLRDKCVHPQYAVEQMIAGYIHGDRKHDLKCTLCGKVGFYSLATGTVWPADEVKKPVKELV